MSTSSIRTRPTPWAHTRRRIGLNIQRRRKKLGLRHRDLAQAIGKSIGMTMRFCHGSHAPRLKDLLLIAAFFKCTVDDLVS